jgi:hypothetical protein
VTEDLAPGGGPSPQQLNRPAWSPTGRNASDFVAKSARSRSQRYARNPERFIEVVRCLAGDGAHLARFNDLNVRGSFPVNTTATIYLSFFDPTGPANMLDSTSRLREPLLWIAGTADRSQPGPPDALSLEPGCPRRRAPRRSPSASGTTCRKATPESLDPIWSLRRRWLRPPSKCRQDLSTDRWITLFRTCERKDGICGETYPSSVLPKI